MAASELNNRLDYLISYSSQLVFVCSDKIKQQSKVVEGYLAEQNEQADLALLTANELTPLVIYREKLFRQLVSQSQDADFNRPLNQLLAPLNNHNGSIIISIFQAEKLPNKLVKELWDLVLQSRFANNKQHLNVLLMGLSDWAEAAKSGLGAKSKDQPIVLNSYVDTEQYTTDEFSDLESFIQDKRQKFAQRLEDRQQQTYQPAPIYKKWWAATIFSLIFIMIFAGMLGWQYPEKVQAITSYLKAKQSTAEPQFDNELLASPSIKATPVAELSIEDSALSPESDISADPVNSAYPPALNIENINNNNLLVTDWTTASAKLDKQSGKVLLETSNSNQPFEVAESVQSNQPMQSTELDSQIAKVGDYQIEDNIELVPAAMEQDLSLRLLEQSQSQGDLNLKSEFILTLPAEHFVIQIAAMANINILQKYVQENKLSQQLWLYKTQRYGADWYVLLLNQHFPAIDDARAKINDLSDALLVSTPFVKGLRQIRKEITDS